jgi:ABC-type Fe3+ transport system permease subunit
MAGGEPNMSDQPGDRKKADDTVRRCDVLIRWAWAAIFGVWIGWFFLVLWPITVVVAAAQMKAQRSHSHGDEDQTYSTLTSDIVMAAWQWTGVCIVLPTISLLVVIMLQLRRLRKRIAQGC